MSLTQCTNECSQSNITLSDNEIQPIEIKEENIDNDSNGTSIEIVEPLNVDSNEKTEQSTIAVQARDWFAGLSSEERSGATRFTDHAFLCTFLTFASSWSTKQTTTTPHNNHVSGNDITHTLDAVIPWDAMISLKEFETMYVNIERSLSNTPKQANRKLPPNAHDIIDEVDDSDIIDNSHGDSAVNDTIIKADEFRIRRHGTLEQSGSGLKEMKHLRQMLDEVALIFPSVFQIILGITVQNPQFIIRPSYFDGCSGEEHFLMFSKHTLDEQFQLLSFNETMIRGNGSLGWLRRISCSHNGDDCSNILVPLSVLVFARFEWAAWESFLEYEHDKSKCNIDNHNPKNHLLSVLGDILSHCKATSDRLLTTDSNTFESFIAPLKNTFFVSDFEFDTSNKVQNIILTPIAWVCSASQQIDSVTDISFRVLDKAIETSLEQIEGNNDLSGTINVATTPASNTVNNAIDQSPQRKKKKKSKKKKSKKISTGETQMTTGNNDNVQSTSKASLANVNMGDPTYLVGEGSDQVDSSDDAVDVTAIDLVTESIDTESVDSDDTLDVLLPPLSKKVHHDRHEVFTVSRQDGRMIVAAPVAVELGKATNNNDEENAEKEESVENGNSNSTEWDSWETVEVRSRNSRKKPPPPPPPSPSPNMKQTPHLNSAATAASESQKATSKKSKGAKQNAAQRKKGIAQKIVGDIINSVIDSIDDEAKKLRQLRVTTHTRPVNSWKNGPPGVIHKLAVGNKDGTGGVNGSVNRETTLRDVLIGKSAASSPVANKAIPGTVMEMDTATASSCSPNKSNNNNAADKGMRKTDQNTAPTYQDTSSSSSNALVGSKEEPQNIVDRKCDTSSSDLEEAPQNIEGETSSKLDTVDTSTPPLPTLLSPENANSATSSVASSLEAPPRGRIHHHSDTVKDVNDVGYHLLDVCDRLSRDMSLFMSRRTLALTARRRERGAILSALQSSVASIWPERCRVELYGSCATQLDLPSSDIDVVVLGAQRNSYISSQISTSRNSSNNGSTIDDSYLNDDLHHQNIQHLVPTTSPYGMLPQHRNAEKVVKLAADLEKQPWAVQVNAIPTASVPVIKVLADPSKLVCSSSGSDWVTTHQIAGNGAPISGGVEALENRPSPEYSKADSGSYPPPTHVPWRGSDVMKGLLSLDITFEGPEHGGIGSTEFSTRTVREACEESGLHPDATPFVQTLMVLKELLAQRKLNEPYSGGLSSYALLLLVLALVRERAVIKEEIELVEQQRRAMSVGELSSFLNGSIPSSELTPLSVMQPTLTPAIEIKSAEAVHTSPSKQKHDNINEDVNPEVTSSNGKERNLAKAKPSSWAMVAKMNSGSKATPVAAKTNPDTPSSKTNQTASEALALKPSFADAVSGSKQKVNVTPSSKTRNEKITCNETSQDKASDQIEAESKKEVPSEATPPVSNSAMKVTSNSSSNVSPIDKKTRAPAFYPQGYNDIVEVLCSGETTAGKLLMHFLLYYGQHFDAQSTAIDISGKHERLYDGPNSYRTPYIQRKSLGNIDPITGMLTVDPIVIYDPLEGSENNNVSRRCFAWNSVRWIFAQSYATLASAVERSATPPTTPNGGSIPQAVGRDIDSGAFVFSPDSNCDLMDPSSPLLRCLLSF